MVEPAAVLRIEASAVDDAAHAVPELVLAIRQHHEQAQACATVAVDHAKRAGVLLLDAKASLSHGQWLPWLKDNFDFTERTAQRYMRAAAPRVLPAKTDSLSYSNPTRDWMFKQHRAKRKREQYRDEVCSHCSFVLSELAVVQDELRPKDREMLKALRARIDGCLSAAK